jgi:hypothetical protein
LPSHSEPGNQIPKGHEDELRSIARKICGYANQPKAGTGRDQPKPMGKQLFAILTALEQQPGIHQMAKFLTDAHDTHLPLRLHVRGKDKHMTKDRNRDKDKRNKDKRDNDSDKDNDKDVDYELRRRDDPNTWLACFRRWPTFRLLRFEKNQWEYMAPFFARDESGNTQHYIFPEGAILPFINHDSITQKEDSSSTISAVLIHRQHHDFGSGPKVNIHPNIPTHAFHIQRHHSGWDLSSPRNTMQILTFTINGTSRTIYGWH